MSNEIIQSAILGVVQGLGEFLPISSTAHLILMPYFFNWQDPGLAYDVALHLGTLIAVLMYFYKDWINIFKSALGKESQGYNKNILWILAIATIPGVLAGYFLEDKAETVFRDPVLIALTLAFFGFFLYLADKYFQAKKDINKITFLDSMIIGIFQAVAVIPGVSRSGATITAGRMLGLGRTSSARFSFLLSTPIILGAVILNIRYLFSSFNLLIFSGILFSALSGYLAIKYLLQLVEKYSYRGFFYYRLILAFIIILFFINSSF